MLTALFKSTWRLKLRLKPVLHLAKDKACNSEREQCLRAQSFFSRFLEIRPGDPLHSECVITDVSSHGMKRPRKGGMSLEFMCVWFMMFARSVSLCREV